MSYFTDNTKLRQTLHTVQGLYRMEKKLRADLRKLVEMWAWVRVDFNRADPVSLLLDDVEKLLKGGE